MDHGWLAYECGGRHKPGYYWVTIPAGLEGMDDAHVTNLDIRKTET